MATRQARKELTPFRKYCILNNLSENDVAKLIGVSPRTVYGYMLGERTPSRKVMKRIQDKLSVNIEELFPL